MGSAPPEKRVKRLGWRAHALAAGFLFHWLCVFIFIVPYPPHLDERTLNMPEVKEELGRFFANAQHYFPLYSSADELRAETMKFLRVYTDGYFAVRRWFAEPYLEWVGSTQSWNMFGGSPPRRPKSLMVEVRAAGEAAFIPFKDHRWGTADHDAANFRDFKTHEVLGLAGWDRQREWYADHWGREWNAAHPDRPADEVKMYYIQYTTPPARERLADGTLDRKPQRVQEFVWKPRVGRSP